MTYDNSNFMEKTSKKYFVLMLITIVLGTMFLSTVPNSSGETLYRYKVTLDRLYIAHSHDSWGNGEFRFYYTTVIDGTLQTPWNAKPSIFTYWSMGAGDEQTFIELYADISLDWNDVFYFRLVEIDAFNSHDQIINAQLDPGTSTTASYSFYENSNDGCMIRITIRYLGTINN